MAAPDPEPPRPWFERLDFMKYFAKDGPGWKLSALIVITLPSILLAIGYIFAHAR